MRICILGVSAFSLSPYLASAFHFPPYLTPAFHMLLIQTSFHLLPHGYFQGKWGIWPSLRPEYSNIHTHSFKWYAGVPVEVPVFHLGDR